MHAIGTLILLAIVAWPSFAANTPSPAVVSKSREGAFELTTSVRTNGCRLELRRYTGAKPHFQGLWIDSVFIGAKCLMYIQHSVVEMEQSLLIEQDTGYGILPIDRDLDGKYEMFIIISLQDKSMVDILVLTDEGWLRHSTPEEMQTRLRIAEANRRAIENVDKILSEGLNKAIEGTNPPFFRPIKVPIEGPKK